MNEGLHMTKTQLSKISVLAVIAGALVTTSCLPKLDTRTPPVEAAALAPVFELTDTSGATHRLSDLVADGPAVIVFYRGYW